MKRTIAVLMIAVLVLSCVACGSGVTKEQVVGTWVVTEAKGDSDGQRMIINVNDKVMTLKDASGEISLSRK